MVLTIYHPFSGYCFPPTYDAGSGIQTRATLVGASALAPCAIAAPLLGSMILISYSMLVLLIEYFSVKSKRKFTRNFIIENRNVGC